MSWTHLRDSHIASRNSSSINHIRFTDLIEDRIDNGPVSLTNFRNFLDTYESSLNNLEFIEDLAKYKRKYAEYEAARAHRIASASYNQLSPISDGHKSTVNSNVSLNAGPGIISIQAQNRLRATGVKLKNRFTKQEGSNLVIETGTPLAIRKSPFSGGLPVSSSFPSKLKDQQASSNPQLETSRVIHTSIGNKNTLKQDFRGSATPPTTRKERKSILPSNLFHTTTSASRSSVSDSIADNETPEATAPETTTNSDEDYPASPNVDIGNSNAFHLNLSLNDRNKLIVVKKISPQNPALSLARNRIYNESHASLASTRSRNRTTVKNNLSGFTPVVPKPIATEREVDLLRDPEYKEIETAIFNIINTYIQTGSPKELPSDEDYRKEVFSQLIASRNYHPDILKQMSTDIMYTMKYQSFPNFLKTCNTLMRAELVLFQATHSSIESLRLRPIPFIETLMQKGEGLETWDAIQNQNNHLISMRKKKRWVFF